MKAREFGVMVGSVMAMLSVTVGVSIEAEFVNVATMSIVSGLVVGFAAWAAST